MLRERVCFVKNLEPRCSVSSIKVVRYGYTLCIFKLTIGAPTYYKNIATLLFS